MDDIPPQAQQTALVTGASSGIGFQIARALARRGAEVVLACRDLAKAEGAIARIRGEAEDATVHALQLDLSSLDSIRVAAAELRLRHQRVELVIANAGVMSFSRRHTADGFELQLGTNHLGHFALVGQLLDRLATRARVVAVSSVGHKQGDIFFDDLHFARKYDALAAYGQSKLANLMFAYELQRRFAATGGEAIALAAHPGGTRGTNINRGAPGWFRAASWAVGGLFGQTVEEGASSILRAACDPEARGGDYYGPSGRLGLAGPPDRVESSARSHDDEMQRRLWRESERLTGVVYPI